VSPRKRLLLTAAALFGGCALAVSGFLLLAVHAVGLEAVAAGWHAARPTVQAFKWAAMIMVVWRWPALADWISDRFGLDADDRTRLRGARWRVAAGLAALEIVLGQNLIARALD